MSESIFLEVPRDNTVFTIDNYNSTFGQFFHMTTPFSCFQETYHHGEPSFFGFAMFSPEHCAYNTTSDPDILPKVAHRPLHRHDYFEFMFILEGEILHRIEDKEYRSAAGTCCLLNCNTRHAEQFSTDFRVFYLNLSKTYVENLLSTAQSFLFREEKEFTKSPIYRFLSEDTSTPHSQKKYLEFQPVLMNMESMTLLHSITGQLVHTILFPEFGATFEIQSLICRLFRFLSDPAYYHTSQITLDAPTDYRLFSRISLLLEDSHGRLPRHELESILHYNGAYLNKIVKKYAGVNLFQYGMSFCMKEAARMLVETEKTISDITQELQFTNRTHFYRLFEEHYGMTPMAYRKENSNN